MIDYLEKLADLEDERSQLRDEYRNAHFRLEAVNIQKLLREKRQQSTEYKELLNAARRETTESSR